MCCLALDSRESVCVELSNTYSVISWPLASLLSVSLTKAAVFVGVIIAIIQG